MAISSLGVGSSILTQDVLDQLREADEAGKVTPITLELANEGDKKDALALIDASMTNLSDSIEEIKNNVLFDERQTDLTGSSVEVTAAANSDIQDFSLEVISLATKQIEQSGTFTTRDANIAAPLSSGTFDLNLNGVSVANIEYDDTTTLEDLKNSINTEAGDSISATIIQISDSDFRLFLSSTQTGASQDISFTDNSTGLSANLLEGVGGLDEIQVGDDASFKFNGQAVSRSSNTVDDLVTGLEITLKEEGITQVSVSQNRDNIMEKFDSFITHYNAAMNELDDMTVASLDSDERGIFSNESTIKNMKRTIEDMIGTIGGGVGMLSDYGFDVDKEGVMTLDKTVLEGKLDDNPTNVEAFFAGGTYTNADLTTIELTGAFTELSESVGSYTKYNATLDLFKTSITDTISNLEDKKTTAIERLDSKYEIMKRKFAAYDLIISQFNSASSMFTDMANASNDY